MENHLYIFRLQAILEEKIGISGCDEIPAGFKGFDDVSKMEVFEAFVLSNFII